MHRIIHHHQDDSTPANTHGAPQLNLNTKSMMQRWFPGFHSSSPALVLSFLIYLFLFLFSSFATLVSSFRSTSPHSLIPSTVHVCID
ncbi:hypothetical protein CPC08DRAFT_533057 [Agrocybe pediades]|nr:hypothetical protein CPC08DRAFT_533057 [Agrocybe pediades]